VIKDDPKKYPSREDAGFMQGATGGWAGGEPGLQKFLDAIEPEKSQPQIKKKKSVDSRQPKKVGEGKDKIYVGFDFKKPEDLADLREGKPGKFIIDDESKYPSRDFLGWLPLQGGFAGGEIGLQKFLEEGDIEIAGPEEKGRTQVSPLLLGISIAAVATTGGLILTDAIDLGENLTINIKSTSLDDNTKLLLEIAIGLLFTAWAGSAVLGFLKATRQKFVSSALSVQRFGVSLAFWCIVLVATYNLAKA